MALKSKILAAIGYSYSECPMIGWYKVVIKHDYFYLKRKFYLKHPKGGKVKYYYSGFTDSSYYHIAIKNHKRHLNPRYYDYLTQEVRDEINKIVESQFPGMRGANQYFDRTWHLDFLRHGGLRLSVHDSDKLKERIEAVESMFTLYYNSFTENIEKERLEDIKKDLDKKSIKRKAKNAIRGLK